MLSALSISNSYHVCSHKRRSSLFRLTSPMQHFKIFVTATSFYLFLTTSKHLFPLSTLMGATKTSRGLSKSQSTDVETPVAEKQHQARHITVHSTHVAVYGGPMTSSQLEQSPNSASSSELAVVTLHIYLLPEPH